MSRLRLLACGAVMGLSVAAVSRGASWQPEKPKPAPAPETKPAPKTDGQEAKPAPGTDEKAPPGLKVGDQAPGDVMMMDGDGKRVALKEMWKDGPVVVTFYRGGWCPFCTKALSAWRERMSDLKAAGGTFVAITPETPAEVKATRQKTKIDATVLVDEKGEAGKAFKVHFELDDATQKKYKGFGVDLEKRNQSGVWELDAPATFVIDQEGVVRYVFADWDYKKRADPDKVIAAVKDAVKKK